jgi:hypothetical protein
MLAMSHIYVYIYMCVCVCVCVKFYISLKYTPLLNVFQISDLDIEKYAADI